MTDKVIEKYKQGASKKSAVNLEDMANGDKWESFVADPQDPEKMKILPYEQP